MKQKLLTVFLCFLIITGNVFAQGKKGCGTMGHLQTMISKDPDMVKRMEQIERITEEYIANNPDAAERAVVTIPVVVHVVYNTSTQNISDAQIQSQITVLNEDFRRLNADKSNTPSAFSSIAADCQINFCLASKDPNGAATTGIVRKSTTVTSFSDDDAVKYNTYGGSNAWPAGSYLNLWVCNLGVIDGSQLLGYAQFPGGAAATDGVVIWYKAFGTSGTAAYPSNKGRTATHEVGHWLNLRHIWGDGYCATDYVSDTPTQEADNYGCPTYPHPTCGNTSDMFMNYMDYTDDACMNMFSTGQSSRMNALFASGASKYSLTTSTGCSGTTTVSYCASKATDATYEHISNVKLNTINNTSASNGGYADFTSISTSLTKGTAYTVTLTPGFASSTYTEYFNVYIDYNLDKDFADAGELVFSSGGTIVAISGTFTVPSTATTGAARMRVVMKDGAIAGPCETYQYGEVEDYTINIGSGTTTTTTTNTVTVGTGTNTTGVAPYGTYYGDERAQYIITNAELVAAGFTATNNKIKSLAFNVYSAAGKPMTAFTIKILNTSAASYASGNFYSTTGASTVYSATVTPVAGWNTYNFSSAFTYNGTGNLLIDICWNNTAASTANSSVRATVGTVYRSISRRSTLASGGLCGITTGTLSYYRPNIKMVFSSSSTRFAAPDQDMDEVSGLSNLNKVMLYPNPATDNVNIAYYSEQAGVPVIINVFNMTGSRVYGKTVTSAAGDNFENIEFSETDKLAEGMYICTVNLNGVIETRKFLLQK